MMRQRGFTLLETVVAAAIICVAAVALLTAMAQFGRFSSHQAGPLRAAATFLAEQTLRVAEDAWKYGPPGTAPAGTLNTTVPLLMPDAAPTTAPVTVTTSVANDTPASAQITVTVSYVPDADHPKDPGSITLTGQLQAKSPLPASTVAPAALIPQPTGAP